MVEAIGPRRGELRGRDLRAVFGARLRELQHVDVVVVAGNGTPIAGRLALVNVAAGHGTRRAMVCPACREPRHLLLAREGALKCSQCLRCRTRRQQEVHRADFRRRGGREEDRLLRHLLTPSRRRTATTLRDARHLANLLLHADRVRVAALRERLERLTSVTTTT